MNEDDVMVIDIDGNILEGFRKPSSEYQLHLEIYKNRKDVNAIIHSHPPIYSSVVSLVKEYIPPLIEDGVMICGERINVAKYGEPGTKDLALKAVEALEMNYAVILKKTMD